MSVKFEKETVKTTTGAVADAAGLAGLKGGKEGLMHEVGQALTKGGGPNGYLAVSPARGRGV
jgi:hypothetical protein